MHATLPRALLYVLMTMVAPRVYAADYYTAPAGSASGTCHVAATPCDLTYALGIAGNGDRISLAPGLYTPTTTLSANLTAVSGNFSLSLVGSGAAATTVKPTGLSGSACGFNITNTASVNQVYFSIAAMTIDGSASSSSPLCAGAGANLLLTQTIVANSAAAAIFTAFSPSYTINLEESALTGNAAGIVVSSGSGAIIIDRSLIAGNSGKGISAGGSLGLGRVSNSTIANNGGGGLLLSGSANLVADSTIANNGSGANSAISGTVSIARSVIAGTCSGTFGSYSVESPGSTCGLAANSIVNVSVGQLDLAVLGDNGGPTRTIMLQPSSYAIGAAGTGCPPVDQRDFDRALPCDAGAVQANAVKADKLFRADFEAF